MTEIKPIAFYLPQFYATDYNSKWWGEGYTEWTAAKKAAPLFDGHHQPQLPLPADQGGLGFHNQTDVEALRAQIELAKAYGLYGFCHYYYWFGGKRVLERPTDIMLENTDLDMPFCLCWANENWSRRWDGADKDILIAQDYDPETYDQFAKDLAPYFSDKRYITINGKALFVIYRPDEIPELTRLVDAVKIQAKACGYDDAIVLGAETFVVPGEQSDPREVGLDGGVEFPPHGVSAPIMHLHKRSAHQSEDFGGIVYDAYGAYINALRRPQPAYPLIRSVFPAWDNTARRGLAATVFAGSQPKLFEHWLSAMTNAPKTFESGDKYVFINAWNEWAEGAHLEPDTVYGAAYLEALSRVVRGETRLKHTFDWSQCLANQIDVYEDKASGDLGLAAGQDDLRARLSEHKGQADIPPFLLEGQGLRALIENIKKASNWHETKTAVFLTLYHERPKTMFQKLTTRLIGIVRKG
ncbi:MAG: glycoside hydrolase family 99-like domain-containing protein [Maricaulaceae bacterium]